MNSSANRRACDVITFPGFNNQSHNPVKAKEKDIALLLLLGLIQNRYDLPDNFSTESQQLYFQLKEATEN